MKSHSDDSGRIAALEAEIARLTAERNAAMAGPVMGNAVDAYIEAIAGLRGEIYTLRAELEEARASEEGAHMIIATERAEVAQLRRRVAELEAEVAKRTAEMAGWLASQHYSYIGRDGKRVLARELEDRADRIAALQPDLDARQADLEKAWMMARDAAAEWHGEREQDDLAIASKYRGGSNPWFSHCQSAKSHKDASDAIRALTPPADLAAKIGGE